jgi:hypothetical protein
VNEEALATSLAERLTSSLTTSAAPYGDFATTVTLTPESVGSFAPPMIQRAEIDAPAAPQAPAVSVDSHTAASSSQTDSAGHGSTWIPPQTDRPNNRDLHRLTDWIYPMVSHKIKAELREGRERLGLITDHYRKW